MNFFCLPFKMYNLNLNWNWQQSHLFMYYLWKWHIFHIPFSSIHSSSKKLLYLNFICLYVEYVKFSSFQEHRNKLWHIFYWTFSLNKESKWLILLFVCSFLLGYPFMCEFSTITSIFWKFMTSAIILFQFLDTSRFVSFSKYFFCSCY